MQHLAVLVLDSLSADAADVGDSVVVAPVAVLAEIGRCDFVVLDDGPFMEIFCENKLRLKNNAINIMYLFIRR